MKHLLTLISFLFYITSFSQTQAEMNQEAQENYAKADNELNVVYKKLVTENKSDTLFIKNLKASQRIWITFRDMETALKYPDREPGYYGSIHPMCYYMYLQQLTADRIKTLNSYLTSEEGDGCE